VCRTKIRRIFVVWWNRLILSFICHPLNTNKDGVEQQWMWLTSRAQESTLFVKCLRMFCVDAVTKIFQKQNFSSLTVNTFGELCQWKWCFLVHYCSVKYLADIWKVAAQFGSSISFVSNCISVIFVHCGCSLDNLTSILPNRQPHAGFRVVRIWLTPFPDRRS